MKRLWLTLTNPQRQAFQKRILQRASRAGIETMACCIGIAHCSYCACDRFIGIDYPSFATEFGKCDTPARCEPITLQPPDPVGLVELQLWLGCY